MARRRLAGSYRGPCVTQIVCLCIMRPSNQAIQFRLIQMSCCGQLLCWVNPRRPMHCPECGASVFHLFPKDRWETTYSTAWLRVEDGSRAFYSTENNNGD